MKKELITTIVHLFFIGALFGQTNQVLFNAEMQSAIVDLQDQQYRSAIRHAEKAQKYLNQDSTTAQLEYIIAKSYVGLGYFDNAKTNLKRYFNIAKEGDFGYSEMLLLLSKIDDMEEETKEIQNRLATEEPLAWDRAKKINTAEEYQNFANMYPKSIHTNEAKVLANCLNIEKQLNLEFILVLGGTFTMGRTDEQKGCNEDENPAHSVTLSNFYIGQTEVTQGQWKAVMGDNELYARDKCDDCPAFAVSWYDAELFIEKLNTICGGTRYRLPTEAEWEYAARGGAQSLGYRFAGSNNIDEVAQRSANCYPVRSKKANELGIFDMCGNVLEWCADWYGSEYYSSSPGTNPKGPVSGAKRVFRSSAYGAAGGSGKKFEEKFSRIAKRYACPPEGDQNPYVMLRTGFRLAKTY